ncbi:universal stress protein [Rubrobacter aplysinae]|uniref:universal stress protein n=1 Tax=Rubrobacter aplysinae TaxID=909625 RepID=UPI00069FEBCC|nr:universal stress protein [Rubrobacter aplysinae]
MATNPTNPADHARASETTGAADVLPSRVLLATDGSPEAGHAARTAARLCSEAGSELHLVHVRSHVYRLYADSGALTEEAMKSLEENARDLLAEQEALIRSEGAEVARTHLETGHPDERIVELAERLDVGLVVLGSRGMGRLKRMLVGSVAEGVAHRCRRPVLVVRGRLASWPPSRIVLADDGSEPARGAGELAAAIGGLSGAKVILVRAYPELPHADEAERLLDARMVDDELRRQQHLLEDGARRLEGLLGKRPQVRIAVGDAAEVVVDAAEAETIMDAGNDDEKEQMGTVIAVGSRGLGPVDRLRLGSVSARVLSVARGPVLIYPAPVQESSGIHTDDAERGNRDRA